MYGKGVNKEKAKEPTKIEVKKLTKEEQHAQLVKEAESRVNRMKERIAKLEAKKNEPGLDLNTWQAAMKNAEKSLQRSSEFLEMTKAKPV